MVRALQSPNLPFDQFTIEQLAGDLLPQPTEEQLVASGFNRCLLTTNEAGSIEDEMRARYMKDRTETVAGVWLGLTAGCASCHDHKFDPLKQREYYQLGAFFGGLADRTWDANARVPGPFILVADAARQQQIDTEAAALPPAAARLSARAKKLSAAVPETLASTPVTYEVVWAEDGDVPTPGNLSAPPRPGEWRGGAGVPVAGGEKRPCVWRATWSGRSPSPRATYRWSCARR